MMSKKWYVIHVFSGSEKKVSQSIQEQIISKNMHDKLLMTLTYKKKKCK